MRSRGPRRRGAAGQAGDGALDGLVEVALLHGVGAAARGEEGGLVHQVGEIGAGEAHGLPGGAAEIDAGAEAHPARVHLEDGAALREIGAVDVDAAVEAAGPEQRGVEDLRAVGGADDDEPGGGVEAVELGEELVQGLLALVVAADGVRRRRAPCPPRRARR